MEAKITNKTSKSVLQTEESIQKALNLAGAKVTAYALSTLDTDGKPIEKGKEKYTSKGKISKKYQTPYGETELSRHVYQNSKGGFTFCPLDNSARIIVGSTPKFSKQVSSKYSASKENRGRYISRSYIQDISNAGKKHQMNFEKICLLNLMKFC